MNPVIKIEAAAQASASAYNELKLPTLAQINAGNYKKGKFWLHGLQIAIENPFGTYRVGMDGNRVEWRSLLAAHYGYICGTKGADGDSVDCFIGPYPQADQVYVINQFVNGKFDEHKVMLAFVDEDSAISAYKHSYERGWNGLHSIVALSITQFKTWLKTGDLSMSIQSPSTNVINLKAVYWDSSANPYDVDLDKLLYAIRQGDNGLIFDAANQQDIYEDADQVLGLDAMVTPYQFMQRKMEAMTRVLDATSSVLKTTDATLTDPFTKNGTVNVAMVFSLSDGQTISAFFHNPDTTPKKLNPSDEMISWKWLINKKDVTIVVAPEKGKDLDVKQVAARLMRLAEKNSPAFQRVNTKVAERSAQKAALLDEITSLEGQINEAKTEIEQLKSVVKPEQPAVVATPSKPTRRKATKSEARDLIDSIRYALDDLSGHTADEFKAADVPGRLLPKIDEINAMLARGIMKNDEDLEGKLSNQIDLINERIDRWNAVNETSATGRIQIFNRIWNEVNDTSYFDTRLERLNARREGLPEPEYPENSGQSAQVNDNDLNPITPASNDAKETNSDESITPLPQDIGAPVPDPRDQDKFYLDEDEQEVYLQQRDAKFQQFVIEKLGFEEDESTSSPGYRQAVIDDDKLEFAKSAFIVNNEVIAYGGQITWGDYSASAFNGALFDSAAVEPNTLCAQIGKDGEIIARVRIELNGMVTFYKGAVGVDVLATSEPSVTDIDKTVKDILGYIEPVMPHLANQLPEQSTPISPLDEFENSGGEAWQVTQAKWVEIMSGHFAFLGQEPNVSDFKEFHKSMVKQALDAGKDIPADVLADYPGMKMETDDEKQERLKKIEQNLSNVIDIASGKATDEEVARVMPLIKTFIGKSQLSVIKSALKGEEGQHFKDKLVEIANVIKTMPSTYETDGQGNNAVAYLHYFKGGMDWYITEKDKGAPDDKKEGVKPQSQAFGLADLDYGGELGYISISDITSSDVELDLYWTPKTLGEIRGIDNNDEQGEISDMAVTDDKKAQFERQLDELMTETDIQKYDQRLDDIAAQIEEADLMDELDAKLNEAADVLTQLLAEAEKMAA